MVNECGGGWGSRVRLQHGVGVVGGSGRAPGFTPISSFYNPFLDLASEVPWPRHYHPRHLFAQAQSLPREINSYQGFSFRPPRCIMLSEICGVVQGEFQGGGVLLGAPRRSQCPTVAARLGSSNTLPLTLEARYNT